MINESSAWFLEKVTIKEKMDKLLLLKQLQQFQELPGPEAINDALVRPSSS